MTSHANDAFNILHPAWLQNPATGSLLAHLKTRRMQLLQAAVSSRLTAEQKITTDILSRIAAIDELISTITTGDFLKPEPK